ncbi:MAG: ABC transporter ATP-binding protein [Ignavibacteriae bacterium]|nr:ABC transporter ATP-binding protein [Ignavibacteriota bacterium]
MYKDSPAILSVEHLTTVFETADGPAPVVQDVSFSISRGEMLGLVGESGCGKTVSALSVLGLVRHPGRVTNGAILFNGIDLRGLDERALRDIRGNRIAMIFQEPMTALNPVFSVGAQMNEVLLHHRNMTRIEARTRSIEMLQHVGIPDPARVMDAYPHQLSGGLRQRVLIAMSLLCSPDILIADEPTTAIDTTMQAQILDLLRRLTHEFGMGVLLITHDLSIVAQTCDRVAVMYASRLVEVARTNDLFSAPLHPYNEALLRSVPARHPRRSRLPIIAGQVPRPTAYPAGCHFSTRCELADENCAMHEPPLAHAGAERLTACWHWQRLAAAVFERATENPSDYASGAARDAHPVA